MSLKRIIDILPHIQKSYPREDVLVCKKKGNWIPLGINEMINEVEMLSLGLMDLGILPNDKVAIVSTNCPEWNIADFAIANIGAVSVPIYPTMSPSESAFILNDATVKIVFVGDKELYQKISALKTETQSVEYIFTFQEFEGIPYYKSIQKKGDETKIKLLQQYKDAIQPNDLLTLIYTSGTTGTPKGVMLSHNNLVSNLISAREVCPVRNEHKVLSFLPLSHIFERMLVYLYLYVGAGIYYAENLETIGENLKEVKPFAFSTVPRLLEKVYDKIVAKGNELSGIKRALFFWALGLGHRYELNGANGPWYEFQLKLANKLIFSKWREALGGNVGVIVSGAAALQPRLARVFTAAQINVLEGYGLTETSPVITVNRLNKRQFGSVGPTINDVEVKIADDGEVLCKGPNVMLGYYKRPDATAEMIKDGWLHTGDIGVYENGMLRITDRKKEIFKTSGGKYIAPQPLENKFKESRFIEQIIVVGESRKHPSALIVPSFAALKEWCKSNDVEYSNNEEICKNKEVIAMIQSQVDHLNADFSNYEMIKKFYLVPNEWSVATGELTPKLSLKRRVILEKFAKQIDALYQE